MFHVQIHLVSGAWISAGLDPPLIDKLISDLLALPGVVPRLLIQLPDHGRSRGSPGPASLAWGMVA